MPCSKACAPGVAACAGCAVATQRTSETGTTSREIRMNVRTRRSLLRQGARPPGRARYGRLDCGGRFGLWSRARAASDTSCPKSRPVRSSLSRAKFAVSWPKAEASRALADAVGGRVKGSLISPAAPADALAGTTSIVTSRSRCCAHALDTPRTRIVPIAYRVNCFMTHLLLAGGLPIPRAPRYMRSEEHTSELQSQF